MYCIYLEVRFPPLRIKMDIRNEDLYASGEDHLCPEKQIWRLFKDLAAFYWIYKNIIFVNCGFTVISELAPLYANTNVQVGWGRLCNSCLIETLKIKYLKKKTQDHLTEDGWCSWRQKPCPQLDISWILNHWLRFGWGDVCVCVRMCVCWVLNLWHTLHLHLVPEKWHLYIGVLSR